MVIPCRSPVSATSFFWVIPRISHAPRHKRVTGIAIFRLKVPPFEDAKAWLTSNRPDPSSFGLGSFGDFHHKNCEKNWGYHEIWMEYQWDINGIQWEYWWIPSGVIKHGLLESSPFSSMISQGTKPPRLGDFQWQRCRTYQILLHLESGHQPSAVHVATSLASQHCYVYRGTGVTPGYTTKKNTPRKCEVVVLIFILSSRVGYHRMLKDSYRKKRILEMLKLSMLSGTTKVCQKLCDCGPGWQGSSICSFVWKESITTSHGQHRPHENEIATVPTVLLATQTSQPPSPFLCASRPFKFNPKCWDSLWMPQGHARNQSGLNLRVGVKLRAELRPQCLGGHG